jgi:hypothetical protein
MDVGGFSRVEIVPVRHATILGVVGGQMGGGSSSVDFAHAVCKRFGRLQRTELPNNRALKLGADRSDLIGLGPGGGDFVCDHAAPSEELNCGMPKSFQTHESHTEAG